MEEWEEDEDELADPEVVRLRLEQARPNVACPVLDYFARFRSVTAATEAASSCGTSSGARALLRRPRRFLPSISAMTLPCSPSRSLPRDTSTCGWTSSPTGS